MDGASIRQELETYIHGDFIYDTEIKRAKVIAYLQSLDHTITEDTIDMILKDMADNGIFGLSEDAHGDVVIKLPSA